MRSFAASPRGAPDPRSFVTDTMRSSTFVLSLALIATAQAATGCKSVRKFLLGDPEQVKPTREDLPLSYGDPLASSTAPPAPVSTSAPVPTSMRLPDGTLASEEYTRAFDLRAHGQLWMAHTTLAPKALSDKGTDSEKKLLFEICKERNDAVCLAQIEGSQGKGHADSDLERAEALAKKSPLKARLLLESKLKSGNASEAELKLLQSICAKLHDAKCVRKVAVELAKMAQ